MLVAQTPTGSSLKQRIRGSWMPNQFTKAEEAGLPKPAGANQFTTGKREGHSQATKDRMRAEKAAELLEAEVNGESDLTDGRRAACKILMEYGKPKLSAVEYTETSDLERMSEEEMLGLVNALITSNPGLIAKLGIGLRPVDDVQPQQSTAAMKDQAA